MVNPDQAENVVPTSGQDTSAQIERLKNQRKYVKGRITYFKNQIAGKKATIKDAELQSIHNRLPTLYSKYDTIQSDLEQLDSSQSDQTNRNQFDDEYGELESMILGILEERKKKTIIPASSEVIPIQSQTNSVVTNLPSVRLPDIKLPSFSGEYEDWLKFRTSYTELIHNNKCISKASKFHYLVGCLSDGKAYHVISSMPVKEENYEHAWSALVQEYDNETRIVKKHMKNIYDIQSVKENSAISLQTLIDTFMTNFRALTALDQPTDKWDLFLVHHLSSRLDSSSRKEIEQKFYDDKLPKIDEYIDILRNRVRVLNAMSELQSSSIISSSARTVRQLSNTSHNSSITQSKPRQALISNNVKQCPMCKQFHSIFKCEQFNAMSVDKRRAHIKNSRLCFNCLAPNHSSKTCQQGSCRVCHQQHHTLLHKEIVSSSLNPSAVPFTTCNSSAQSTTNDKSQILLATAIVKISDINGILHECRALLDSASMSNFMTGKLAQILHLKKHHLNAPVTGIGEKTSYIKHMVETNVFSRFSSTCWNLQFGVLPKITGNLPLNKFDNKSLCLPEQINERLADPFYHVPGEIDILLGAEAYSDIMFSHKRKCSHDSTIAIDTDLGFVIMGKCATTPVAKIANISLFCSTDNLNNEIKRFWEQETIQSGNNWSREERDCEEHFIKTTARDDNGRYIVSLPMKENVTTIGNSYITASQQLLRLEKSLASKPDIKRQYDNFIMEYIDLGHMYHVDIKSSDGLYPQYFMPHHGVHKPASTSTKLRVVFNASAKTTNGISLNDVLKVGPTVQQDLFSILVRFRTYRIAIKADIAKMYRQISIRKEERHLQRILWRNTPNESIEAYELSTVTYGTASAPFLATRTLNQVAFDGQDICPEASKKITEDFYVDDLLSGGSSIDEAAKLCKNITSILAKGCFELRKWCSNDKNIFTAFDTNHIDSSDSVLTLGLIWKPDPDHFIISSENIKIHATNTKRTILSTIASIYDPLGLISPVTLLAKHFMKETWMLSNIGWDDQLPIKLIQEWQVFKEQLSLLDELSIPRCIIPAQTTHLVETQLHGFGDASEAGYGCCIYLRSTDRNGYSVARLICGKSRIVSKHSQTIPRLELCASVLLAQLTTKVTSCINILINRCFLWTDSEVTLYRIKSTPSKYSPFVGNRIARIQELTPTDCWNHVKSSENPADLVSRGLTPSELKLSSLWWNGPEFLRQNESEWPSYNCVAPTEDVEERVSKNVSKCLVTVSDDARNYSSNTTFVHRFSNLTKLLRCVAIWLIYFTKLKRHTLESKITALHTHEALLRITGAVQRETFPNEIRLLTRGESVSRHSKLYKLHPFLDSAGLIRVGGRLANADDLNYDQKHPFVLDSKHHFSTLLVRYEHRRNLHLGASSLLSLIRQRFWLLGGRSLCKRVVRTCICCFRKNPIASKQLMGDLPAHRLQPARPFVIVGIDFCGPFYVTQRIRGRSPIKTYAAIFVCFTTKAMHIEVVEDLSADAFLAALRCFTARRGRPTHIYCDNGTNFVGVRNKMSEFYKSLSTDIWEKRIQRTCTDEQIQWHHIPPRSPHHGGIWEAAVKSTKTLLSKVVGLTILTSAELRTLLTQVEACLNSRPLHPTSEDPDDPIPLTPGHFLIGAPLTALPDPNLLELKCNRLSRWQLVQQLSQSFWKRWSCDYLNTLQQRSKWCTPQPNIKIDTIVLLKEDNLPPLRWSLARVIETISGADGKIRVVKLKTLTGELTRSITKICPLPIED